MRRTQPAGLTNTMLPQTHHRPVTVVGLTVLQPEFLERFPNARFDFHAGPGAQRGTFKGVWLNAERTEWALEEE